MRNHPFTRPCLAAVLAAGLALPAAAEEALQPPPGTQPRLTRAVAEQARIARVFATRAPSAAEALAAASPDRYTLEVVITPENPADPTALASAAPQ